MSSYWGEFITLAVVHFFVVITPGPDFAVTVRQSVRFGHKAGIGTGIGIGAGILVHVSYTLLGFGALMHTAPWLLTVAEFIGASYLLYLGVAFIRQVGGQAADITVEGVGGTTSFWKSFVLGFITNVTNPKATLFFLAVFTTLVKPSTPMSIQMLYGVWMCVVNGGWCVLVSLLLSNASMRQRFLRIAPQFERFIGGVLILFAARLFWEIVKALTTGGHLA